MKSKGSAGMNNDVMMEPYTASYSSDISIGSKKSVHTILELYKDFDNNTLAAHDDFADSVIMFLADGMVLKGKQQMIGAMSGYRSGIGAVSTDIHAWIPMHINDRNDDVVAVWGTETDTAADGKVSKTELHEVWWLNKDGKVTMMRQFTAKTPPNM